MNYSYIQLEHTNLNCECVTLIRYVLINLAYFTVCLVCFILFVSRWCICFAFAFVYCCFTDCCHMLFFGVFYLFIVIICLFTVSLALIVMSVVSFCYSFLSCHFCVCYCFVCFAIFRLIVVVFLFVVILCWFLLCLFQCFVLYHCFIY